MELRRYLAILRHRKWLVVLAVMVSTPVAFFVAARQPTMYRATTRMVLYTPSDQATDVFSRRPQALADAERRVSLQLQIITSADVRAAAAKRLGRADLGASISAGGDSASDLVRIAATSSNPVLSRDAANAIAAAYVDNRRQFAIDRAAIAGKELQAKLDELQRRIGQIDAQIAALPQGDKPVPVELTATRNAASTEYNTVFSRLQELQIDANLRRGDADVLAAAPLPTVPVDKKTTTAAALGAFVGLLLGLGIVVIREQLDDVVRTAEEVEAATGWPVIAEIPYDRGARDNELALVTSGTGRLAEVTRGLRTSLEFATADQGASRVLVTSSNPLEGKTLIAAMLSAAYARTGFRTIAVSADLRRPRLERALGAENAPPGLADLIVHLPADLATPVDLEGVLTGASHTGRRPRPLTAYPRPLIDIAAQNGNGHHKSPELDRTVLIATGITNLALLPAGTRPANPTELLGSRAAGGVLSSLGETADVVVIDTPPVLAVADGTVLAARADGILFVACAGRTRRRDLQRAAKILAATGTPVIGIALNKVRDGGDRYAGYYDAPDAKHGLRRN